jgi:hypothetical protein
VKPPLLRGAAACTLATAILFASVSGAQARRGAIKIAGTASAPSPGPCAANYANQCLGGDPAADCTCIEISNASAKGAALGKGASTADLSLTIDDGAQTANPGCRPIFGSVTLSNSQSGLTLAVNLAGTDCASRKSGTADVISGGFGIANSSNLSTGWGLLSGTLDRNSGALSLKLKPNLSKPPAQVNYVGTFSGQSLNVDCPQGGAVSFPETGTGTLTLARSSEGSFTISGSVTLAGGSNPQCPAVPTCCFDGTVQCSGTATDGEATFSCNANLSGMGNYNPNSLIGTWILPLTSVGASGPSVEGSFSLNAQ